MVSMLTDTRRDQSPHSHPLAQFNDKITKAYDKTLKITLRHECSNLLCSTNQLKFLKGKKPFFKALTRARIQPINSELSILTPPRSSVSMADYGGQLNICHINLTLRPMAAHTKFSILQHRVGRKLDNTAEIMH